jgi:type I restriction enzyme, S subunit
VSSSATPEASWTRVAFGDVVQLVRTRSADPESDGFDRYVGLEHIDPGDLTIRRWGFVSEGTTFTNVFRAGQVLFGKRRAYQRKVAVADFDGVCSGDIYVLEPSNDCLLPELLAFICQSEGFFQHAVGTSAGSLSPRTNWSSLASYEFQLPPREEQRRLANALLAFDEYHRALRLTLDATIALEKTVFAHALRGGFSGHNGSTKDSRFGRIPCEWSLVPIDGIATVAYGISEAVASNKDPSIGWPILTGANITLAGALDLGKLVYVAEPSKPEFILRTGDLLLNWRSGSEEHVGKTAVFQLDGNWTYASFILRIRPGPEVDRWFLWRLLNHMREFRLFGASTSQQVNFKMNAAMFRQVEVVVPPIDDQASIVDRLRECWDREAAIRARANDVHSMMARLAGNLASACHV